MGHGFKHGGAGGGGGLNFRVLGGDTAPANPKENDIWVATDEKITSYTISATAPEEPIPGMVWIIPSASGEAVVTLTKKNPINIYPMSAQQYVSGDWAEVIAKNRKGDEWVDWWNGELYVSGNEYTSVTGGWILEGTGSKDTTSITVGVQEGFKTGQNAFATHKNFIDMGKFTKVKVHVIAGEVGPSAKIFFKIYIYDTSGALVNTADIMIGPNKTISDQWFEADVSGLSGGHKVQIYTENTSGYGQKCYATFDEVRCE